jgi:peptide/nickel transport system permease protein
VSLVRYLLIRLLFLLVAMLAVTSLTFALLHATADPELRTRAEGGDFSVRPEISAEARSRIAAYLGLDRPLFLDAAALRDGRGPVAAILETRYAAWLGRLVTGSFGESLVWRRPVSELLQERLPRTLLLEGAALLLALIIAVPAGFAMGLARGRAPDRFLSHGLLALHALPEFWVGATFVGLGVVVPVGFHSRSMAARIASGEIGPFAPEALLDLWAHTAIPVVVLAYGSLAHLAAQARAGLLGALESGHARCARQWGAGPWAVVWRHGVRGAAPPLLALVSAMLPALFAGSVLIERIFNLPGMGLLLLDAALAADVPVVMAATVLFAAITGLAMVLADLAQAALDPRVRLR